MPRCTAVVPCQEIIRFAQGHLVIASSSAVKRLAGVVDRLGLVSHIGVGMPEPEVIGTGQPRLRHPFQAFSVVQEDFQTFGKAPEKMQGRHKTEKDVEVAMILLRSVQTLHMDEGVLKRGDGFRMRLTSGGLLGKAPQILDSLGGFVGVSIVIR